MTSPTEVLDQASDSRWVSEAAWTGTRRPILQANALPAACYVDEAFFNEEKLRVFGTSWVCVGLHDELDAPGSTIVRSVAGQSIILTRNANGELRGFRNACRHRGTQLLDSDCTLGSTIRCPYHRWTYDLDGLLVATPLFADAGVDGFDPSDYGLHPVCVTTWQCFVLICLSDEPPPVAEWFGDLDGRLAGYGLADWRSQLTQSITINANWKLISENFQEYYHLRWIHPELSKVSRVEDHYRYQGNGMYCGQTTTPISADERGDWSTMPPAEGLNESDLASGRFIALFPNVLLSVLPNHVFVMRLDPIDAGSTREICTWLLPPAAPEVDDGDFLATRDFWLDINHEDIGIVQRGQAGLATGGYTPGRLSPRFEEPLHRFHNMLADRFTGSSQIPTGDESDDLPIHGNGVNPLPWHAHTPTGEGTVRP
ncbi:MAG: aromatic ring-hydroxylating dioxygenase subunit alpha [Acidimicrobiales bacterium]|nr:aromatic ring-hydroxylating dioxygenase subunit alpha [Acidimicrobiales bacterium]